MTRARVAKTAPVEEWVKMGRGPMVWILVAVLAVLLGGALLVHHYVVRRAALARAGEARSLAVLPFQNVNRDPQIDFLQFSLADA